MSEEEAPQGEDVERLEEGEVAEAQEATPVEGEDAATSDDADPVEKPKRRSRAEERINELTREKYEAQRQIESMQRQMQEMQQRFQAPPQTDEPPSLKEFDYDEDRYSQAIKTWNQRQIERYQENQREQSEQQQRLSRAMADQQRLQQAMMRGQQKYPDFATKINDPTLPPIAQVNPAAYQAVLESDSDVDIAYYLANNPQEVYALASMSPMQAIRKVWEIEQQFKAKPSHAIPPKPPTKVVGNSEAVKDPSKMTSAEFMEWRKQSLKSRS